MTSRLSQKQTAQPMESHQQLIVYNRLRLSNSHKLDISLIATWFWPAVG